jgi:uncharacterized membrane protein YfcA
VGDWLALRWYWGKWDRTQVKLMLPISLVTLMIGTYLLATLPGRSLRIILGVLTLTVGVYKVIEPRLQRMRYVHHTWHGWFAGAVSGLGAGLASAGGPPLTAYLMLVGVTPLAYIATSAIMFAVMNIVRLPALVATDVLNKDKLLASLWFLPLVWLGIYLGRRLIQWIDPKQFESMMTVILVVAGIILIVR